jgi:hypothetical protein
MNLDPSFLWASTPPYSSISQSCVSSSVPEQKRWMNPMHRGMRTYSCGKIAGIKSLDSDKHSSTLLGTFPGRGVIQSSDSGVVGEV